MFWLRSQASIFENNEEWFNPNTHTHTYPNFQLFSSEVRIWKLLVEYDAHNKKKKWQLLILEGHFYAEMKDLTLLQRGCIFSISLNLFCTFMQFVLLMPSEFRLFLDDFNIIFLSYDLSFG